MGLKVTLQKEVVLDDSWFSKEDWDSLKNDRASIIDLLDEDRYSFLKDLGGIDGLVQSFDWVDSTSK